MRTYLEIPKVKVLFESFWKRWIRPSLPYRDIAQSVRAGDL